MLVVGRMDGSLQMAVYFHPCPDTEGSEREALVGAWHPARVNPLLHKKHSSQLQPTNPLLCNSTPKPSLSFSFLFIYSSVFFCCVAAAALKTQQLSVLCFTESGMTSRGARVTLLSVKAPEGDALKNKTVCRKTEKRNEGSEEERKEDEKEEDCHDKNRERWRLITEFPESEVFLYLHA